MERLYKVWQPVIPPHGCQPVGNLLFLLSLTSLDLESAHHTLPGPTRRHSAVVLGHTLVRRLAKQQSAVNVFSLSSYHIITRCCTLRCGACLPAILSLEVKTGHLYYCKVRLLGGLSCFPSRFPQKFRRGEVATREGRRRTHFRLHF